MKTFKSNDKTQITAHFNVSEFRCKCGENHDTQLDEHLVQKLEQLFFCTELLKNHSEQRLQTYSSRQKCRRFGSRSARQRYGCRYRLLR